MLGASRLVESSRLFEINFIHRNIRISSTEFNWTHNLSLRCVKSGSSLAIKKDRDFLLEATRKVKSAQFFCSKRPGRLSPLMSELVHEGATALTDDPQFMGLSSQSSVLLSCLDQIPDVSLDEDSTRSESTFKCESPSESGSADHDDAEDCSEELDETGSSGKGSGVMKRAWLAEEDTLLLVLVKEHGPRRWSVIAAHLPGRVGKQCRERYAIGPQS